MAVQVSDEDALHGPTQEPVFNNEEVTFTNRPGAPNSQGNSIIINFPLTLELQIDRHTMATASRAHFTIYNLKAETRKKILHDRYDMNDISKYRQVVLNAGYDGEPILPIIFQGNIAWAYSYRQKENWITEIECFDGGFGIMNGQANFTVDASQNNIRNMIQSLIGTIPKTKKGAIGAIDNTQRSRGYTFCGNSWQALQNLVPDADVFIDNEAVNVIGKNEYIRLPDEPFVISSETGMLGTPRRSGTLVEIPILFEPRVRIGMLVEIQGQDPYWNGLRKVIGFSHRGVISGAIGGQLVTTLTVFQGTRGLSGVDLL